MVEVLVNGAAVQDGADYLASLPVEAIKEIRVYPPIEAQFRFAGRLTRNGVIDIILR